MKKLLLLFALLLTPIVAFADGQYYAAPPVTAGLSPFNSVLIGTAGIGYHQISWAISGTITTCSMTLDSSPDGTTWTVGGAVASQNCQASSASSSVAHVSVNYVRMTITMTGTGSVSGSWNGYVNNPSSGGGGSVTSVVDNSGLFNVATATTIPTFTFQTQVANTFLAGPPSGGAVAPTWRVHVIADFPAAIVHGNSTKLQLSDGTGTSGNVAKFDANGNVVDGGLAVGSIVSGSRLINTTAPLGGGGNLTADRTLTCTTCATTTNGGALTGTPPVTVSVAGAIGITTQNFLNSALFTDVTASAATRGDGLFAIGATPMWTRVGHSATTGGYWKWNGTDVVASTLGASGTGACTNQAVTAVNGDAAPTCNFITSAYVDSTIALSSETISTTAPLAGGGDLTAPRTLSITGAAGRVLAGVGPAFTATPVLGVPGTTTGTLALAGITSGTVTITPQATAGTVTFTLPNASGTAAVSATTPLALSATTGNLTCTNCAVVNAGNTFTTGTQDFTGTTLFKGRVASALTTATNGEVGYDSLNQRWHVWNGFDSTVSANVAKLDLTVQAAVISATPWFTPAVNGMYQIRGYAKVTQMAATSSILGAGTVSGLVLTALADDSIAITHTCQGGSNTGTGITPASGNAVNTTQASISYTCSIYLKSGTAVTYSFGYTTVPTTPAGSVMNYELHLTAELQ